MNRRSAQVAMIGCLSVLLGACAGPASLTPTAAPRLATASPVSAASGPPAATPPSTASPGPSVSERPGCPYGDGGHCLGPLAAGTYSSSSLTPTISYTVPAGWANIEDLRGNFSLLPPGGSIDGVNAGTSDYLGVFSSVVAEDASCNAQPAPGVAATPSGVANALATRAGLTATAPKPATIATLKGFVLDIKLKRGWTHSACSGTSPDVPLILGMAPSDLEHSMNAAFTMRLYLLSDGPDVLAIEVDDVSGGSRFPAYDAVLKSVQFGAN